MREGSLWTNLSLREQKRRLAQMGTPASLRVVRWALKTLKVGRRMARKKKSMGRHPDRNAQFENIARLRYEHLAAGDPVISVDTKKKELLGNYHRPGHAYTNESIETYDHDFPAAGGNKLIPHGVYDLAMNLAHINLNTSHDTGELCCDSIAKWWNEHGRAAYPNSKRLLVLCDGGGGNSSRNYLFKEDLQRLANLLGITIRIAHYPPYCSKHNPIEHRVFPHVTKACRGVIFHTVQTAQRFIAQAKTTKGLRIVVGVLDKVYATGRKVAKGFKSTMKILFDAHLPKWNYQAIPQPE